MRSAVLILHIVEYLYQFLIIVNYLYKQVHYEPKTA